MVVHVQTNVAHLSVWHQPKMTLKQKRNISRGIRRARRRKRLSLAMKASWQRRRNNPSTSEEFDREASQPTSALETAAENAAYTNLLLERNVPDPFSQIEQLALTWKALDLRKSDCSDFPQLESILEGAITRIRFEIILACYTYTNQPPEQEETERE
jgi:hypothetical protein